MVKERKTPKNETQREDASMFNLYLFPPQRFNDGASRAATNVKKTNTESSAFLILEVKK